MDRATAVVALGCPRCCRRTRLPILTADGGATLLPLRAGVMGPIRRSIEVVRSQTHGDGAPRVAPLPFPNPRRIPDLLPVMIGTPHRRTGARTAALLQHRLLRTALKQCCAFSATVAGAWR
ncbi:hypothetical protein JIQ42_00419 [Leishmania sp. Namibia]|uniref:hypothetical protein n=1 Tax=Leishmania sp. Namibia TaxID=2802991 RepID=UPI001B5AF7EF|nr:hypothetical protein JIQ42_00419 [Leishmania sp. Namibia]